jgi:hypothetical protein
MPDIGVKPQIEIFLVEVSSQAPSSDIPTPKEAKIRSLDVAAIWPFCWSELSVRTAPRCRPIAILLTGI